MNSPTVASYEPLLPDDELLEEYRLFLAEDAGIEQEALEAARQMRNTPIDDLDRRPLDVAKKRRTLKGKVGRRAPANPFHSPKLGKWRQGAGTAKVDDPALQNNPLRGRLVVTIAVNCALLLVFIQALVFNFTETGSFYASKSANSNLGPSPQALFDMGGLNANAIRQGQWIRLFWSMWMHSGWLHIGLNLICQVQYFYMLEPDWGCVRTLLLFWVSGMTGNVISVICDPCKTTVGSSGGLFGLMGGVVPYCIEFWHSIPRPMCILIFSVIVVFISLATGLSKATDTWAHFGGLIGGLLFGFGTITTPAAFSSPDKPKPIKRQVKKNAIMRWLQHTVNPECKCGLREWAIRASSWGLLIVCWSVCMTMLYSSYTYQPPGSLTYSGVTSCCCCYWSTMAPAVRQNWMCMECDAVGVVQNEKLSWKEHCDIQGDAARKLLDLDQVLTEEVVEAGENAIDALRAQNNSEWFWTPPIMG